MSNIPETELTLEEIKAIELDMVKYFHELCEKHGLKYYLIGGTLLGAVRHGGFIPWDDDIDVEMPRADYEKLIKIFDEINTRDDIDLVCIERRDDYYLPFAKLINTRTHLQEEVENAPEIGVFIDILPVDNLSDDYGEATRLFKSVARLNDILTVKNLINKKDRSFAKRLVIFGGKTALMFCSRKNLLKAIIKKSRSYEGDEMTAFVGVVTSGIYGAEREIFPREWFSATEKLKFEDTELNVCSGHINILKNFYGDYMQLPPVEKRVTHHGFKAWR